MKVSDFFKAFDSSKGLHGLSTQQASENILNYNIYFKFTVTNDNYSKHIMQFDIDKKYQSVFKLDPFKNFNEQYKHICKFLTNSFDTVYFYTDYKKPKELILQQLSEAHNFLLSKNITPTVPRLQKQSKLKDRQLISKFLEDIEPYKQGVLF